MEKKKKLANSLEENIIKYLHSLKAKWNIKSINYKKRKTDKFDFLVMINNRGKSKPQPGRKHIHLRM